MKDNTNKEFYVNFYKTEGASRFISKKREDILIKFMLHLVKKLGIDTNNCRFKHMIVRLEMGQSDKFLAVFKDEEDHGVIEVYCKNIKRNLYLLLEVVAHEMVHARQWGYNTLKWVQRNGEWCHMWNSEYFHSSTELAEYLQLPWEAEALSVQRTLVDEFLNPQIC